MFKAILTTVLKALPFGNIVDELKRNKESKEAGKGKIFWPGLIIYLALAVVVIVRILYPDAIPLEALYEILGLIEEHAPK